MGTRTSRATVEANGSVRIPEHVLQSAGMCEGTEVTVVLSEDGVTITRSIDHDPGQAWFWTDEWQEGEFEVMQALRSNVPPRVYGDLEFMDHLAEVDTELSTRGI